METKVAQPFNASPSRACGTSRNAFAVNFFEERRLPACTRRQLADEIVFGRLPALPRIFVRKVMNQKNELLVDPWRRFAEKPECHLNFNLP
jgi:hypothetical protein